eukprot:TRINITY_DN21296_c1_g1_i1.p1 TRINITY_DN21296_c1_g1~~TRINITY_DN21296_c1_g1_i1.p1  ORF type:complete len:1183 (-),score=238.60 TRINITY_DN21296_c1_g1_i1:71-3208(-)
MADKVMSHGQPRGFGRGFGGLQGSSQQTEPLLRSSPPKGSPGENAMRGVRKLSIVNVPQAMLSLWFHIGQLVPADGELTAPHHPGYVACAFVAAYFSLGFGIADFVLYVWVDDAFVRQNKKLVTLHYFVEIMVRLPPLVLFHVIYRQKFGYSPILWLFLVDLLITSTLLQLARLVQRPQVCWKGTGARHTCTNCMFSIGVSVPLTFVNIVFFDPGMIFFYVNQVFYVVKYVELILIWYMVSLVHVDSHGQYKRCFDPDFKCWGVSVLSLPRSWYQHCIWWNLAVVLVNIGFVWFLVPRRRRQRNQRTSELNMSAMARQSSFSSMDGRQNDRVVPLPPPVGSPSLIPASNGRGWGGGADNSPGDDTGAGPLLDHLDDIFELLFLLSKASSRNNRSKLLDLIVEDLWHQALPIAGVYDDGNGCTAQLSVDRRHRRVMMKHKPSGHVTASLVDGVLVVSQRDGGELRGRFNGHSIAWDTGKVWTRRSSEVAPEASPTTTTPPPSGASSFRLDGDEDVGAPRVLQLVLPQLAIALQWEPGAAPNGVTDEDEESVERLLATRPRAESAMEAAVRRGRPLLAFLIGYALATRRADFLSDLYWALVCLSHEEGERGLGFRDARRTLLRALRGGAGNEDPFLMEARRLLRGQLRVWRSHVELITKHSGRASGGGSWNHKTEALRSALRRWPELRFQNRSLAGSPRAPPSEDWQLLASPRAWGGDTSNGILADMVSPPDLEGEALNALPIDPLVQFRGVVIEESEVIASKQAPLLLTCRTRPVRAGGAEEELQEKYLLKEGDDLRQDQLMLQMMALMRCVWEERLPPSATKMLQLANFKALAVTPQAGYVKFVADSVPLSDALHQSRGNLVAWLQQHKLQGLTMDEVMDNLCGSVAASCVVTYVLGIGDRHLENICITRSGILFHIDFGFILGDDPKPMAPPVRLPQQVAQALLTTDRLGRCFNLAAKAYLALRPFVGLWSSILQLTAVTGGAGCSRLASEPMAAMTFLQERLRCDQLDEERAAEEFLCLMRESSEGLASIVIDKVHAAGLFWR